MFEKNLERKGMLNIDLHMHTQFSDGMLSPEDLLNLAVQRKLNVISITDHDTLEGFWAAEKIISRYDIKLIPGVEISTNYMGRDVHLLAYNIDYHDQKLIKMLNYIKEGRIVRAKKILEKLEELGIKIDFKEVQELAGHNNLIGRPHIARVMVENGFCVNKQAAFNDYISNDAPAYFAKPTPTPEEILAVVRKAGGVLIVAHPFTIKDDKIVQNLLDLGIDGLEVYYGKAHSDTIENYERMALERGLIRTGGTDFHGEDIDYELFGQFVAPLFVLDELEMRKSTGLKG